jgi:hypothetical protein
MIRRALLKAVAIPGYQVPFASREMPMPYGWGTGGVQVTAAVIGPDDVLKVIDQGSDDTTNAVSIRKFFAKTAGVATTTHTADATLIQTRHRIPERPLREGQILVYQVPIPEPLRFLEPRETETRKLHALADYGLMHVRLYEDISRHGHIATTYAYPVEVAERYVMDPSPTPKVRQPEDGRLPGASALRGWAGKARLRGPALHSGEEPRFRGPPVHRAALRQALRAVRGGGRLSRRGDPRRSRRAHVRLLRHGPLRGPPRSAALSRRGRVESRGSGEPGEGENAVRTARSRGPLPGARCAGCSTSPVGEGGRPMTDPPSLRAAA